MSLAQAELAAHHQNWPLLTEYLQMLVNENPKLEPNLQEKILNLALVVLEVGDFRERWDMSQIFAHLGPIAISPLTMILADQDVDDELRWFVARILGQFNHPDAIDALAKLMIYSDSEDLSSIAASALASLGVVAIPMLTNLLNVRSARLWSTTALAQIDDPGIIQPLLSVVNDPVAAIRVGAIEALIAFNDPHITTILIDGLKDVDPIVRKEAAIGLAARSNLHPNLDIVNLLKPLLFDINLEVCQQTALALGKIKTPEVAVILRDVCQSPRTPMELKISLIRALAWMENDLALSYLEGIAMATIPTINSEQISVVILEIIRLCGRIKSLILQEQATDILINLGTNYANSMVHREVKQALAEALGALGRERSRSVLLTLANDADDSVKWHSLAALKQLKNL